MTLDDLMRHAERIDARRNTRIDRNLQQDLAYFIRRHAIPQRARHMILQLVGAVQYAEHRQIEHAARLARKPFASPTGAPAILGYQFLQRTSEVIRRRERLFDELLADNILADGEAEVVSLLIHVISPFPIGLHSAPASS